MRFKNDARTTSLADGDSVYILPAVEIEPAPLSVTKYTAESIIAGFDVVIDALDSIDARYALNDACVKFKIPFIYGGGLGVVGSIFTILSNKTSCFGWIFPALY